MHASVMERGSMASSMGAVPGQKSVVSLQTSTETISAGKHLHLHGTYRKNRLCIVWNIMIWTHFQDKTGVWQELILHNPAGEVHYTRVTTCVLTVWGRHHHHIPLWDGKCQTVLTIRRVHAECWHWHSFQHQHWARSSHGTTGWQFRNLSLHFWRLPLYFTCSKHIPHHHLGKECITPPYIFTAWQLITQKTLFILYSYAITNPLTIFQFH